MILHSTSKKTTYRSSVQIPAHLLWDETKTWRIVGTMGKDMGEPPHCEGFEVHLLRNARSWCVRFRNQNKGVVAWWRPVGLSAKTRRGRLGTGASSSEELTRNTPQSKKSVTSLSLTDTLEMTSAV